MQRAPQECPSGARTGQLQTEVSLPGPHEPRTGGQHPGLQSRPQPGGPYVDAPEGSEPFLVAFAEPCILQVCVRSGADRRIGRGGEGLACLVDPVARILEIGMGLPPRAGSQEAGAHQAPASGLSPQQMDQARRLDQGLGPRPRLEFELPSVLDQARPRPLQTAPAEDEAIASGGEASQIQGRASLDPDRSLEAGEGLDRPGTQCPDTVGRRCSRGGQGQDRAENGQEKASGDGHRNGELPGSRTGGSIAQSADSATPRPLWARRVRPTMTEDAQVRLTTRAMLS